MQSQGNWFLKRKIKYTDWLLILSNLVPVYGVWMLNWNARDIFLVYSFETIIIGFFTLLRLGFTGAIKKRDVWSTQGGIIIRQPAITFMLFFLVHYGTFVAIQLGLFFSISGIGEEMNIRFINFFYKIPSLLTSDMLTMLSIFFISYTFKFIMEFILSGTYKTASLGYLMFQPYGRIFIQQATVITGSLFLSFGAGKIFILVFASVKIFFEVFVDYENLLAKMIKSQQRGTKKERESGKQ